MLTVITPAETRDLTLLATVKSRLGITASTDDALLGEMITKASRRTESWCNRVFALETVRETIRRPGFGWSASGSVLGQDALPIVLERYPVASVASVTEDDTALDADTDYEIETETGFLHRLDTCGNRREWCGRVIVIEYDAGYELLTGLPDDIEAAVIELVKATYLGRKRDATIRSETVDGVGATQFWVGAVGDQGILPAAADMLQPYRRIAV